MQPVIIRIFFYISFFPSDLRKNRVACSFETPSLIVESFKIITRSEMFVAAYQSPGFRYELFNTGYLERSRQLADSWNVIYAWRYPTENSPIIRRRNFQVSRFPLIITDIITCRFSGKRKKEIKIDRSWKYLFTRSRESELLHPPISLSYHSAKTLNVSLPGMGIPYCMFYVSPYVAWEIATADRCIN